jgi:hypothetical protein
LGLLDKPRSGRPGSSDTLLQEAVARSGEYHPAAAAAAIRNLPKNVREGIWRSNKRSGLTLDRDRKMRVSRVSGPIGLPELLGVLSLPGLLVLVTTSGSCAAQYSGGGMWLANKSLGGPRRRGVSPSPSLTEAVGLLRQESGDQAHRVPSQSRLTTEVFPTFHKWAAELAAEFGERLRLDIGVAEADGKHAMNYLPHLRDASLMGWFEQACEVRGLGAYPRIAMRAYRSKLEMVRETLQEIRNAGGPAHQAVHEALVCDSYFCWMRVKVFEGDEEE